MEAIVGCKLKDVIDLSADIAWTPIEMDDDGKSNQEEEKMKDVEDLLGTLSFLEKIRILLPHCLPLKERMKDCTISYVDLLCRDPLPPRSNDNPMPQGSRRLAL